MDHRALPFNLACCISDWNSSLAHTCSLCYSFLFFKHTGSSLPQGLCTGYSLFLEGSSPRLPTAASFDSFWCPLLRVLLWPSQLIWANPSLTLLLSLSFSLLYFQPLSLSWLLPRSMSTFSNLFHMILKNQKPKKSSLPSLVLPFPSCMSLISQLLLSAKLLDSIVYTLSSSTSLPSIYTSTCCQLSPKTEIELFSPGSTTIRVVVSQYNTFVWTGRRCPSFETLASICQKTVILSIPICNVHNVHGAHWHCAVYYLHNHAQKLCQQPSFCWLERHTPDSSYLTILKLPYDHPSFLKCCLLWQLQYHALHFCCSLLTVSGSSSLHVSSIKSISVSWFVFLCYLTRLSEWS